MFWGFFLHCFYTVLHFDHSNKPFIVIWSRTFKLSETNHSRAAVHLWNGQRRLCAYVYSDPEHPTTTTTTHPPFFLQSCRGGAVEEGWTDEHGQVCQVNRWGHNHPGSWHMFWRPRESAESFQSCWEKYCALKRSVTISVFRQHPAGKRQTETGLRLPPEHQDDYVYRGSFSTHSMGTYLSLSLSLLHACESYQQSVGSLPPIQALLPPPPPLASGSQSADLCWGDLVFRVGYLKACSLFSTLSLFHYPVRRLFYNPRPRNLFLWLFPPGLWSIFSLYFISQHALLYFRACRIAGFRRSLSHIDTTQRLSDKATCQLVRFHHSALVGEIWLGSEKTEYLFPLGCDIWGITGIMQ